MPSCYLAIHTERSHPALISNISQPSETVAYAESKRKIGKMKNANIIVIIRVCPITVQLN